MIFGMNLYQAACYFVVFSFLGWCVEVIFHAVTVGKVINRGFLNGPVCPVYGFGVLAVLAAVHLAEQSGIELSTRETGIVSDLILFLIGFFLATLVELIAGAVLDACFHMRWWDYSGKPFNFHGYICLEFSIIWGLGIALVMKILMPVIEQAKTLSEPGRFGWWVLALIGICYMADFIVTVMTIAGLNEKLEELDKVRASMRTVSDKLSDRIATTTIRTSQSIGEGRVQASLAKAELRDAAKEKQSEVLGSLQDKKLSLERKQQQLMKELSSGSLFGTGRLLKAFPDLTHRDYKEALDDLKKRLPSRLQ